MNRLYEGKLYRIRSDRELKARAVNMETCRHRGYPGSYCHSMGHNCFLVLWRGDMV